MADWTPGPWTSRRSKHESFYIEGPSYGSEKWLVAEVSGRSLEENESNARIIVAALEMADILRYHLASLEASEGEFVGLREDTRALLARINGGKADG